ncbi:Microcystin dependent protein [Labilithrix luteola]|uniref:Microcystin dependent protein n=1 Tax=Labilithrix luteola TaxID=1391654 RepID=A0A0K1QD04_9BACT|nr:tail fiber protein [Labilithrix luteola]AKV03629.1 Microcystin dependent protein [Labilithrix luteola]
MGTPYLGEIRIVSFFFAPKGWALCNGQLLSINQNTALFSLLGTTYGGDGRTTFALPNFQGRMPIHFGNGYTQGQASGEAAHTLVLSETLHGHLVTGMTGPRVVTNPANAVLASGDTFGAGPPTATLAATAVDTAGGGQPHQNMQPYLALNFCIALQGIFPSRN